MNNFVSIAQLQEDHKLQIQQLKAQINGLETQLTQQGEIIKQQALVDSAGHYQQLQDEALQAQRAQLETEFQLSLTGLVENELTSRTQILQSNIHAIENAWAELTELVFEHCSEICLQIVKKITSEDSAIKLDIIKKSLLDSIYQQKLSDVQLTVHLNPMDAAKLKPVWESQNIMVKTTDSLASGDVKVSSDTGVLSGILEERVKQIMDSINDDQAQSS